MTADRPLLLNVMASLAFAKGQGAATSSGQAAGPMLQFVDLPLTPRQAPDGSLSISIPADWNLMGSRWDDYRRGQSYWVSDLEGGKIYPTDSLGTRNTTTGDDYEGKGYNWVNFEGLNPNHLAEAMREVSSYELEHLSSGR